MCGIAGVFNLQRGLSEDELGSVYRMTEVQYHRGPDGSGLFHRGHVGLGSRRLSLIDLSDAGTMPIRNEDGKVWITFNGEIYNFQSLHEELTLAGHRFRTKTDTEVIVHGYEEWGIDGLLERLRGMFAFAIYDDRLADTEPLLFLARDRFGIKPLYYNFEAGRRFVFASEVRPIRSSGLVSTEQDADAILLYLMFGSVPNPFTTVRSIRSLPPGHYIVVRRSGLTVRSYYSLLRLFHCDTSHHNSHVSQNDSDDSISDQIKQAVDLHLRSDAPLGVFLSGGIDSTALVALSKVRKHDVATVAITFGEAGYSEEYYQRLVSRQFDTRHHEAKVGFKDFYDCLEGFFRALDQPTVDGINTYFVSMTARQAGLKAILSGVGADEVFCGYSTYRRVSMLRSIQNSILARPLSAIFNRISRYRNLSFTRTRGNIPLYLAQRGLFSPILAARLVNAEEKQCWNLLKDLDDKLAPKDSVSFQQFMEIQHYLNEQLLRDTDVFGMAQSLEIRVPYLDHILVEHVLRTPPAQRLDRRWPKPMLTKPLSGIIPHQIIFRQKRGFGFPIGPWLHLMKSGFSEYRGHYNNTAYETTWRDFIAGRIHWSRPWSLLVLARMHQT
jgi:asparagine synthase (glutamine-hydrolysing)